MDNPTYVVTGASRGIGRALSIELANHGACVLMLSRPSASLDEALAQVQALSPRSSAVPCDLADSSSIKSAVDSVLEQTSIIHGLVHNAGDIAPVMPMLYADNADWSRSIQVNLVGVQELTRGLAPAFEGDHRVRVTTISSGASLRPVPSWSAYCVAKAGQDMWARCLAEEGRKDNISAISIAPGIVNTGMQEDIRSAKAEHFPLLDTFVGYHRSGQLTNADDVAKQLLDLVMNHSMEDSGHRFDVREL